VCGFALRNLVALPPFFAELHRVVKPGGSIALLDVSAPDNRVLAWGHGIYFNRIVPRLGGLLSDRAAYAYLPKSVSYLPAPTAMLNMLTDAGFERPSRVQLSGGLTQLLTATRAG
jgi:demethylmenaquinone methyltransferase/2-methoxy-6-polyprenyl-1,4-benzoquinol methylase